MVCTAGEIIKGCMYESVTVGCAKGKNNTYALLIKMRKIYAVIFLMGNFFCRELLAFEADAEH